MTLPASFLKDGFLPPDQVRKGKYRRLMIGTDGWPNTGKTEFILSAPGPGLILCLDRGFDAMLDNPRPPETRRNDFAFKVIQRPLPTQMEQKEYLQHWQAFYGEYRKALENADARTVGVDGDSDSWELQRLAEFGRITQVPALQYPNVNAARKAMIARAWDSGKIVIATNKIKDGYETKMNNAGKEVQIKTGKEERQGFSDWGYLWQLQIRHIRNGSHFGLRILMCKADTQLEGLELWDSDCCFQGLVGTIYPHIPLAEWGYK